MQDTSITTGEATYCPEDNKLRLYIGRVPREEYLRLKADGWKPLYKQREAGGGDFVATWTPSRYATALAYGEGAVLDEDMSPQERAADRAERFSGYRDKRLDEATGHADHYDSQPAAHGYQSQARAERAAARHDRIGDRAVDAWDKAEYWQQRTAGVIAHALYKSTPGLRMGRINELESEIRKTEVSFKKSLETWERWQKVLTIEDVEKQNKIAKYLADYEHGYFEHPITKEEKSLYKLAEELPGKQIAEIWLARYAKPEIENCEWLKHYKFRLAYERQMLEAQGGRLEQSEMEIGGRLGGKLIVKINRSAATKRIKSVVVLGPRIDGYAYRARNIPGTEFAGYQIETERLSPESYTAPDDASLKELEDYKAKIKAHNATLIKIPLINPTIADAERLQALWNDQAKANYEQGVRRQYHSESIVADCLAKWKPSTVCQITQSVYSENSKSSYARAKTRSICEGGKIYSSFAGCYAEERQKALKEQGRVICNLRTTGSDGHTYGAKRVIVLTDKPQKALPKAIWKAAKPEEVAA